MEVAVLTHGLSGVGLPGCWQLRRSWCTPNQPACPAAVQLASQKLYSAGRLEPALAIGNVLPRFLLEQLLTALLYYSFLKLPFIGVFLCFQSSM